MTIDLPHMIVTAVLILIVIYGVDHSGLVDGASKKKRSMMRAVAVFVVIFILNLFWPYGATA